VSGVIGVSYLVGVAAFGIAAQLLYVLGASLALWQVVVLCTVPALGVIRARRASSRLRELRAPRLHLAVLPVVAFVALLAVDLWFQPLWAYDSWTFWTPKAHALWALGGLDARWFSQTSLTSPDYPILLPAVEAAGFRFTGYEVSLLDLQSLVFFAAFLRAVYELAGGVGERVVLWAVLAMLAAAPSVADQLASAEADIPVAVFFATAGLVAARWLSTRDPGLLVVAAVLAAGAAATKVEGTAFVIALFAALALVVARGRRSAALAPAAAAAGALAVGVVPWRIWLAIHDVPVQASTTRLTRLTFLSANLTRVPEASGYLLWKMVDPRAWLLVIPLFAAACVVARRRGDRLLLAFVLGAAALALAGLVLAYWSTTLGLHYQLATSGRRVVTGVVFFCAATTPLLAATAGR
jgi:hypothetical protein